MVGKIIEFIGGEVSGLDRRIAGRFSACSLGFGNLVNLPERIRKRLMPTAAIWR
jgi:hypothetical protein